jgi:hypothetical protein
MSHYLFTEPGTIPGVAGQFAGCRVTVGNDGTLVIQPLAQHPHFEQAPDDPSSGDETQFAQTTEAATPEPIKEDEDATPGN